jgi:hypothetical protein
MKIKLARMRVPELTETISQTFQKDLSTPTEKGPDKWRQFGRQAF